MPGKKYFVTIVRKLKPPTRYLHGRAAKKILLAAAFSLIIFLFWVVFYFGRNTFDQLTFDWIAPYTSPANTKLMLLISFLGKHSFLIPVSLSLIAWFIFRKNHWMAIRAASVMLSSLLLMLLLKKLIQRPRPAEPLVDGITNFSFPSGHAFLGVAFYGLLIWYASDNIDSKWLRRSVILGLLLLIAAIAFSRIYLRVHYATDVIAGICIGFVWLDFCLWFIDKKETASIAGKLPKV